MKIARKRIMHKRILKQFIFLAGCALCADAMAVATGFYIGLMGGPASNNGNQQPVQVFPLPTAAAPTANTVQGNPKSMLFGFRAYMGYKFNKYASFELGLDNFSTIKYTLGQVIYNNPNNPITLPHQAAGGVDYRARGLDIVGKLEYTFRDTIDVFGKLGAVAIYTTTPGGLNVQNYHTVNTFNKQTKMNYPNPVNSGSNTYSNKIVPTFTIGAGYDFSQSLVMDFSVMNVLVGGSIKNITTYALGLSYHFVDRYCGQFLCDD